MAGNQGAGDGRITRQSQYEWFVHADFGEPSYSRAACILGAGTHAWKAIIDGYERNSGEWLADYRATVDAA